MLEKALSEEMSCRQQKAELESDGLIKMLNLRSACTESPDGHSDRVASYAMAIGRHMDLPEGVLRSLNSAALLHDIGKIGISSQIVGKLGRLTEREFEIMRLHSNIAVSMLQRVDGLQDSLPMIKHHHERWDGRGYPDGLKEHDIPLGSRIIAVAETFDILISDIPWRDALTREGALQELRDCAGTQFDPGVVDVFVDIVTARKIEIPVGVEEECDSTPRKTKH